MESSFEIDLLAEWAGGQAPDGLHARIAAHPRFAEAVTALATAAAALIRARDHRSHAAVDAGRYVAKLAVMWLDARGELTLPALKRLCAETGLLSAGRARDFLGYMRQIGFVEEAEAGAGVRPTRYRATPRCRQDWTDQLRGPVGAAALLAPAAADLLARLDEPQAANSFVEIQGGGLLRSTTASPPPADPVFETFYHPSGGLQVLTLLIAGAADPHAFPSRRPVALPLKATAQTCGVSALQLKRILAKAREHGLLAAHPRGAYALTEAADPALRAIYAFQFVQLLDAIARTLKALG